MYRFINKFPGQQWTNLAKIHKRGVVWDGHGLIKIFTIVLPFFVSIVAISKFNLCLQTNVAACIVIHVDITVAKSSTASEHMEHPLL